MNNDDPSIMELQINDTEPKNILESVTNRLAEFKSEILSEVKSILTALVPDKNCQIVKASVSNLGVESTQTCADVAAK